MDHKYKGFLLVLSAIALSVLSLAWAEALGARGLSKEDIEALRRKGEAEGWTFTVSENPATKYSLEELCGEKEPEGWWLNARFDPCSPTRDLPARFDWRDSSGCTGVRNQGGCGSCWAFATVGVLECNIKIRDGVSRNLSEQWLVSCNTDGWGCDGGGRAFDYFQWKTDPCGGTGAVLETDFPYVAWEAPCDCPYPHHYLIDGWAYLSTGMPPVENIKQAIIDYGPVYVSVYANDAFQAYSGGIFNGCESGETNHAVVLVGWDDDQGPSGIWFLRNSWGALWGEGGYMRIPYGCSSVGQAATYINYHRPDPPSVTVTYPNGFETLGGLVDVTWTATDPDVGETPLLLIDLDYSPNAGSSWSPIDSNQTNDGSYCWDVSTLPAGDNYLVRITATDTTDRWGSDQSDDVFSITSHGAIAGMVDQAKGPLSGAVVTAEGWSTRSDTADAGGRYVIKGVPVGLFDVTASAAGYCSYTNEDVEVVAEDTTTVDFALVASNVLWNSLLGGSGDERGQGVAVDGYGSAYVVGYVSSTDFPITSGPYDSSHNGATDAFVAKLAASGSALIYATFLGGSGDESGYGVSVDASGDVYLAGYTTSSDFPVTAGAFDETHNGGWDDGFVVKMNSAGDALLYATFLGGTGSDGSADIVIDHSGSAYVTGWVESADFPVTYGSFDTTHNGGYYDVYAAKLTPGGDDLSYATFLGGGDLDWGNTIGLDGSGNVFLGGVTYSADFPTTSGAFDQSHSAGSDAFVLKLHSGGDVLGYSTFLGGGSEDEVLALATDDEGCAYVTGFSSSTDFPTTTGSFDENHNGDRDAFVSKVSGTGDILDYSTFLGGLAPDAAYGIALDGSTRAIVTGGTESADFPITSGICDSVYKGGGDVFVAQLSAAGSLLDWATFLGGSDAEEGLDIAANIDGSVRLTGWTNSADFTASIGAFDGTPNGGEDCFVVRVDFGGTGDLIPPEAIDDLSLALDGGSKSSSGDIHLWWSEPFDESGVVRYVIYRSTTLESSGDSLAGTTDTSFTDMGAAGDADTSYYYAVRAVDAAGNKSEGSNRVGECDRLLPNGE